MSDLNDLGLKRVSAYEHLGRWIETFKDEYDRDAQMADTLLSRAVYVEKRGDARFATPKEYQAAAVLYHIVAIEDALLTGEANELHGKETVLQSLLRSLDDNFLVLLGLSKKTSMNNKPEFASKSDAFLNTFLSNREMQLLAILEEIDELQFNPLEIPDNGKSEIKAKCLKRSRLFVSGDAFDHTWTAGRKINLFRMKNHDKYTS